LDRVSNKKLPSTFLLFDTYIPAKNCHNKNNNNNKIIGDSMFDSGSFCNFITENLVNKLDLKKYKLILFKLNLLSEII